MTRFAYEVPLNHLEDFDEYQDLIVALSFLCKDTRYFNWLRYWKEKGKMIILDNSFNELGQPDLPEEMIRIFYEIQADMVISPDSDGWSLKDLRECYREMISSIPKEKVLVVVKSREERDMFLKEGVSYYCTTYEQRPKLPINIQTLCYHFLGLLNPFEIRRYSPVSCDTSMPLKLALQGKTMLDWTKEGCSHLKTTLAFFHLILTKEELELSLKNCQWIKQNLGDQR